MNLQIISQELANDSAAERAAAPESPLQMLHVEMGKKEVSEERRKKGQ
jgi:hypothetical protein